MRARPDDPLHLEHAGRHLANPVHLSGQAPRTLLTAARRLSVGLFRAQVSLDCGLHEGRPGARASDIPSWGLTAEVFPGPGSFLLVSLGWFLWVVVNRASPGRWAGSQGTVKLCLLLDFHYSNGDPFCLPHTGPSSR